MKRRSAFTLLEVILAMAIAVLLLGGPPGSADAMTTEPTVLSIGERLMTAYVLPLQVGGLLLTAALIGAVLMAMPDRKERR